MTISELLTTLDSAPLYESYSYVDSDGIHWSLTDWKADTLEVSAFHEVGEIDEKYACAVNRSDSGYAVRVGSDNKACVSFHAFLPDTADIINEIIGIGAKILSVSLMLERMAK